MVGIGNIAHKGDDVAFEDFVALGMGDNFRFGPWIKDRYALVGVTGEKIGPEMGLGISFS